MKMAEVRQRAKEMGLKANGSKASVIRRIQQAEGNERCFGSRHSCDQLKCLWHDDCMQSARCG